MINTIIAEIDDNALAESLVDCEVGEEKTITLRVTDKGPGRLTGNVTSVEGYEKAEESEEEHEAMPKDKMSRKVPKAIVMVGMGMGGKKGY